jgi:hypothetical protein
VDLRNRRPPLVRAELGVDHVVLLLLIALRLGAGARRAGAGGAVHLLRRLVAGLLQLRFKDE